MKKFVCLCSLLVAGHFASAADVLKGICTGLTTSGKTVVMTYCAPSSGGNKLVSCTPRGAGRVKIFFNVTFRDGSEYDNVMLAKYSTITANYEDGFAAEAYSVTRRDLRSGLDHNSVMINAMADSPSAFSLDLGPGWRFAFHNAECHFENL
jgi:hypothetical protein